MTKTKTVYISPEDLPTWEKIHAAADAENRGVGYYICRMFENKIKREKNEKN